MTAAATNSPENNTQSKPQDTPKADQKPPRVRKAKETAQSTYTYISTKVNLFLWGIILMLAGGIIAMQVEWLGDLIGWAALICLLISGWRFIGRSFSNAWVIIATCLSFLGLVVMGLLFFQSAHIYASAGRAIAPESGLVNLHNLGAEIFNGFPILGWGLGLALRGVANLLKGLQLTAFGLLGVAVYAVVQSGEVAPVILKASPETLRGLIGTLQKFKKVEVNDDESNTVRELANLHNDYYESLIRGLEWWRVICYTVDFFVCAWFAPWIVGGWGSFDRMAGWDNADWPNIIRGLISIVFFEVAVRLWIMARKGVYLFTNEKHQ